VLIFLKKTCAENVQILNKKKDRLDGLGLLADTTVADKHKETSVENKFARSDKIVTST